MFVALHIVRVGTGCARNGHLEVPVYFLKSKQGYTVRKMEKDKLIY
jgi:hypothetical protein